MTVKVIIKHHSRVFVSSLLFVIDVPGNLLDG